ncbi:MAG: phosphoenolpyruvate carboxylase [Candidatus Magasanikbacteria bacterium CG_4_9_14_0_2_um_filter_42_11]|uniref:Phosphoenolpyruvate carboxylase n=1 Tax=Candidatus Magasanikbacteria bacterium CG_4_9_14_0_2_um_filter_42_11 TaxID=1974643 RepID=A0A2M8F9Y1_9BACT|nr:MAG: phosphoenolpyruvate carboxylase [Candidatus Magasanikbacteria bacterium CG10_big_fil_rev_8_21_14_0_10_43_9]PIY92735.1 MAG: phosphoenolpyruvate carboxylase [Candidatus Magasanikbacteria bacterium CG_4_10_14_0_8_um_filter_42_12]PJC52542.1 MAG: phosphoenolpyruvate carboxylase [Candidatus Magasanikbacteria bacterium CG_4_9_14_0_2_um_filter_42_11]
MNDYQIPRCMSTQHPDNVSQPFFAEHAQLGGEDEVQEAYYAYSHLGCGEQMWDAEGKEVDAFVVKKLLTKNEQFFRTHRLGHELRLTVRVPNPEVEKTEGKILLETLESIPRSFDAARAFYGETATAPIFEVILPMTTSAESLDRIYQYYKSFVAGKGNTPVRPDDISIREWVGEFRPETVQVIPLFEDKEHMLASADILREYLKDKEVSYQRVFLARSDPAVNYGSIAAVLINKIALQRLHLLGEELGIPLYPILGAGSAPFRGNLRPQTVEGILRGYPSVQTFTVQSSFKFDNDPALVGSAIRTLTESTRKEPIPVDEEKVLEIIERYSARYQEQLAELVDVINEVAVHIPKRRKRKLHIGLFGYSRSMGKKHLPRAITFTASLYSLGVPPELLGLDALTEEDMRIIKEVYPSIESDLKDAIKFVDLDSPYLPVAVKEKVVAWFGEVSPDDAHVAATKQICTAMTSHSNDDLSHLVLLAAQRRGFLG